MGRAGPLLAASIAAIALTACIGATPRADFDAEVRARGGGLTTGFVDASLTVVASQFGSGDWRDLEVMFLTISPGNRTVTASVRDPRRPDFVDVVAVKDGDVLSTTPVQDAADLPLDDLVVLLSDVAIEPIDRLTSDALAAFDEAEGYVKSLSVSRVAGEASVRVDVESARRTATVIFDAAGNLLEVS